MSKFKINDYDIEVLGKIEQAREEYPSCDEQGNEVIVEKGEYKKAVYKNKEGVIISKVYKLIGGKPYEKFKKTDKVTACVEVPKTDVYDLIIECAYLCRNDELKEYLQKKDVALKFLYTNGNGYKAYYSYLCVYQNRLIMYCGFGSMIQQITAIEKDKVKEVTKEVIERANPESVLLATMKL